MRQNRTLPSNSNTDNLDRKAWTRKVILVWKRSRLGEGDVNLNSVQF